MANLLYNGVKPKYSIEQCKAPNTCNLLKMTSCQPNCNEKTSPPIKQNLGERFQRISRNISKEAFSI